jgi:hypothetical protein
MFTGAPTITNVTLDAASTILPVAFIGFPISSPSWNGARARLNVQYKLLARGDRITCEVEQNVVRVEGNSKNPPAWSFWVRAFSAGWRFFVASSFRYSVHANRALQAEAGGSCGAQRKGFSGRSMARLGARPLWRFKVNFGAG